MRTRCPHCETVFRITAEQLRVRFGMVRCGQCQAVFNAFDSLVEGGAALAPDQADTPAPLQAAASLPPSHASEEVLNPESQPEEIALAPPAALRADAGLPEPSVSARPDPIDVALAAEETLEQSTRAARDAGLMAVRDLSESPGYDRWSASALETGGKNDFSLDVPRRQNWPFTLASVVLLVLLLTQVAYYFRSDLSLRFPDLAQAYRTLNIEIPLARQADLVSIEVSDLQSDSGRGLLILQATLKNRAEYRQDWPLLELTLTDTNDAVVSRRVLKASDYLPAKADPKVFAGSSEIGIKLWLEAKQPAAGYRLFVFYP